MWAGNYNFIAGGGHELGDASGGTGSAAFRSASYSAQFGKDNEIKANAQYIFQAGRDNEIYNLTDGFGNYGYYKDIIQLGWGLKNGFTAFDKQILLGSYNRETVYYSSSFMIGNGVDNSNRNNIFLSYGDSNGTGIGDGRIEMSASIHLHGLTEGGAQVVTWDPTTDRLYVTSSSAFDTDTSSFVTNSQTGSFLTTSSYNTSTGSFVTNSQTSSFVANSQTSSFVVNSQTGSFVTNSQTSSMSVLTASFALSAPCCTGSSEATGSSSFTGSVGNPDNPVLTIDGRMEHTGSLLKSGSFTNVGSFSQT